MLVYRVEDEATGSGPFITDLAKHHDAGREDEKRSCQDGPLGWHLKRQLSDLTNGEIRFGCSSKSQLKNSWFFDAAGRENMAKHGGVVRVFEVPDDAVIEADEQVVFDLNAAECVDTFSPADL